MPSELCDPGANPWVAKHLYDCIYTTRDYVGFGFGMASIAFWLVAQIPQFILNIKQQSVEALSSWFLAQWLLGDTCNLVGCILTGSQLPTQTWTAVYFISADMVMLVQYIFYMTLERRRHRTQSSQMSRQHRHAHYSGMLPAGRQGRSMRLSSSSGGSTALPVSHLLLDEDMERSGSTHAAVAAGNGRVSEEGTRRTSSSAAPGARTTLTSLLTGALVVAIGLSCAFTAIESSLLKGGSSGTILSRKLFSHHPPKWARRSGVWLGWTSSAFYLSSRSSQLYKNWSRSCCEGLSLSMFLCAISANISYGLGILIRSYTKDELKASAPWLFGSFGVVVLDVLISLQGCFYPSHIEGKDYSRARASLLVTSPASPLSSSLLEDRREC